MSKIAEEKARNFSIENNLDPWGAGQIYGVAYDQSAKDIIEQIREYIKERKEKYLNCENPVNYGRCCAFDEVFELLSELEKEYE